MAGNDGGEEDDDDYMGDLSLFLPPDPPPSSQNKKAPISKPQTHQPATTKRPKTLSWQEHRRLDRDRRQREEDQRTLQNLEAAIPPSNLGFKMLQQMGYSPGSALGRAGAGRIEPVGLDIRRSRAGIGTGSSEEAAERREKATAERKRRREEDLAVEFGSRQKTQYRTRRVTADYKKAEASLAQLENREVVEPTKDEEEKPEEEEEEEEITEEDLIEILAKLRDEHRYCLYCGCQYESAEALLTECPGLSEEDH